MRLSSEGWPSSTNVLSYSRCQTHPANLNVPLKKPSTSQMDERSSPVGARSNRIPTMAKCICQVRESKLHPKISNTAEFYILTISATCTSSLESVSALSCAKPSISRMKW